MPALARRGCGIWAWSSTLSCTPQMQGSDSLPAQGGPGMAGPQPEPAGAPAAGQKRRSPAEGVAPPHVSSEAAATASPKTLSPKTLSPPAASRSTPGQEQRGTTPGPAPQAAGGFADMALLSAGKRCRMAASGDGRAGSPAAVDCAAHPMAALEPGTQGVSAD